MLGLKRKSKQQNTSQHSATIFLKKIPPKYASSPYKERLQLILRTYFKTEDVVLLPPRKDSAYCPGFVNFRSSNAKQAEEQWGTISELIVEELDLHLDAVFSADGDFTAKISKDNSSKSLIKSNKLTRSLPFTIFINDIPAEVAADPRFLIIIQNQFNDGLIEISKPKFTGQKFVTWFANYADKTQYLKQSEPFGDSGILEIREDWLNCDLRIERRKAKSEDKELEELSKDFNEVAINESKFMGHVKLEDFESWKQHLAAGFPTPKKALQNSSVLVLWDLDVVQCNKQNTGKQVSPLQVVSLLTKIFREHCCADQVYFEIAYSEKKLGKSVEELNTMKQHKNIGLTKNGMNSIVLKSKLREWLKKCCSYDAILFMVDDMEVMSNVTEAVSTKECFIFLLCEHTIENNFANFAHWRQDWEQFLRFHSIGKFVNYAAAV